MTALERVINNMRRLQHLTGISNAQMGLMYNERTGRSKDAFYAIDRGKEPKMAELEFMKEVFQLNSLDELFQDTEAYEPYRIKADKRTQKRLDKQNLKKIQTTMHESLAYEEAKREAKEFIRHIEEDAKW